MSACTLYVAHRHSHAPPQTGPQTECVRTICTTARTEQDTHNQALQQRRPGWSAGHGCSRAQIQHSRQISRQNKKQANDGLLFLL